MTPIEWTPELSIGVPSIDDEHKTLLKLANDVMVSVKGKNTARLKNAFYALREYTFYHFGNEEKYMEKINYPRLAEHKLEHANLRNQVKFFHAALIRKKEVDEKEVLEFIKHWLLNHILQCDLALKHYGPQVGLKAAQEGKRPVETADDVLF